MPETGDALATAEVLVASATLGGDPGACCVGTSTSALPFILFDL